jgi:hypothetical protein
VTVVAEPGSFRLLAGTPRIYTRIADSGRKREQGFCEQCGSPLYATAPGPEPRVYGLRVGTIDQRAQLRPAVHIWTRSALPWIDALAGLPKLETQPG